MTFLLFFEKDKFETPFLRYMISKNETFQNTYAKLSKNANFKNITQLFKQSLKQLTNIKTLTLLLITFSACLFIKEFESKTAFYSSLIFVIISIITCYSITYKGLKKYDKLTKVKMYNSLFTYFTIMMVNFSGIKTGITELNFTFYLHFICVAFLIIVTQTCIAEQNNFKTKYKHLI